MKPLWTRTDAAAASGFMPGLGILGDVPEPDALALTMGFLLTAGTAFADDAMKKDSMAKDGMKKDEMKTDAMKKEASPLAIKDISEIVEESLIYGKG